MGAGLILIFGAVAIGVPVASATTNSNVYVVCGLGESTGGSSCPSLQEAIDDALSSANNAASNAPATIILEPGTYCPVTLPYGYRSLTIEGAGPAGIDDSGGPVSYSGYEASLSTITNDSLCFGANSPPSSLITFTSNSGEDWYDYSRLEFDNVTFKGTGDSNGSGQGMRFYGGALQLRDDLFEDFPQYGLYYGGGNNEDGVEVTNSAFIDNDTGAFISGYSGVDDSTFAGNTVGVQPEGVNDFISDTITGNTYGVDIVGYGYQNQVNDTIVAGNTTADCTGDVGYGGDWEDSEVYNSYNLQGAGCRNGDNNADSTDISYDATAGAIGSMQTTGITPHFNPPSQAQGAGQTCLGRDQLEDVNGGGACDIGSINTDGVTTDPDVEAGSATLDFGTVPQGVGSPKSDSVSNAGGDLVGVRSVTSSNPDFAVTSDDCTLHLLYSSCNTGVTFTPSTQSAESGTVTFDTTAGSVLVTVTGTGGTQVTAPSAPQNLHGSPSSGRVTLSWDAPASDGGSPITSYEIRYAPQGTTQWQYEYQAVEDGTSYTVAGLQDGTAYDFEVAAANQYFDYGQGAPWTDRTTVTPGSPDASRLTAPRGTTLPVGHHVQLTTTLTDAATRTAIGGATVTLLSRPAGHGSYAKAATATTDASGKAGFTVRPTINTAYEFAFPGSAGHTGVGSPVGTVTVEQVVRAVITSTSVKHGQPVTVYGTVSPNETGKDVVLQVKSRHKWAKAGSGVIKRQRLPKGGTKIGYVIGYVPKAAGREQLRVVRAATAVNGAGRSPSIGLRVT